MVILELEVEQQLIFVLTAFPREQRT